MIGFVIFPQLKIVLAKDDSKSILVGGQAVVVVVVFGFANQKSGVAECPCLPDLVSLIRLSTSFGYLRESLGVLFFMVLLVIIERINRMKSLLEMLLRAI